MTGQDLGRLAEAQFVADACRHALLVSVPHAEFPGYDAVVDTGKRLLRIQIKGVRLTSIGGGSGGVSPRYSISTNQHRRHSAPLWDILAIYPYEERAWIFYPSTFRPQARTLALFRTGVVRDAGSGWDIFDA